MNSLFINLINYAYKHSISKRNKLNEITCRQYLNWYNCQTVDIIILTVKTYLLLLFNEEYNGSGEEANESTKKHWECVSAKIRMKSDI